MSLAVHMHDKENEQCVQLHFLMGMRTKYFKSQQHYLKLGYIIQLSAFQWDTPTSPS